MNKKPVVVIPGDEPPIVTLSPDLDTLSDFADVRLYMDRPADVTEQVRRVAEGDILMNSRGSLKFPRAVLQQLPGLKMIAVCGIGFDAIDLQAATEQKIIVSNIPGRTAAVVAEHALGLMLAVARQMAWMTSELKAGRWNGDRGISLAGRQAGIIGTGNIGCEMIRLCQAIGMNAVAWSFHPCEAKSARLGFQYVTLDQLLESSDVVSLHVRHSEQTRHLIGARELSLMKREAMLINTARGSVVDSRALADALQNRSLFGAGLDVFEHEPISVEDPLLKCHHVVLTPHTADQTQVGIDLLTTGAIENIRAFIEGRPQNVVNPDVLREN